MGIETTPAHQPSARGVLEVEGEPEGGIERAEEELERALVAGAPQGDANGAEPVSERTDARDEDVEAA